MLLLRMRPGRPSAFLVPQLCLLLSVAVKVAWGTAIANGVIGQPQVQCTEDSVTFSVRTENTFRGNVYIKSKYTSPSCRQEYFSNDYNGATFSVRIGECGMKRIRQLQPNGMNYILVFVVNFHPQFVTKVDRAYNVRCFYAQVDKAVSSQLEVSMLTTQTLEDTTTLIPNCDYRVRKDSANGPEVRYAQVGDKLVHVWTCTDARNSNFGMLVKNCFVDDGTGSTVRVLDTRGCPVFTPVIQSNLVYDNTQTQATAEIWAYKFPDRANLYFRCQIQICNKRDNECIGVTPPNCPQTLKSEFVPNSQIVPGDPTRVISSGSAFPSGGFAAASETRNGFEVVQPQEVVERFENNRVENVRTYPSNSGYGNSAYGSNNYGSGNYQENQGNTASETANFVSSSNRLGNGGIPAGLHPATLLQNDEEPQAIGLDGEAGRKKRRKPSMDAPVSSQTTEEEDEMLMDVIAEEMYIADIEDDPDKDEGFTHFPFTSAEDQVGGGGGVCLNSAGVGLLVAFAVVAILLIIALSVVIVAHRIRLGKAAAGGDAAWSSGASSASEVPIAGGRMRRWVPSFTKPPSA